MSQSKYFGKTIMINDMSLNRRRTFSQYTAITGSKADKLRVQHPIILGHYNYRLPLSKIDTFPYQTP